MNTKDLVSIAKLVIFDIWHVLYCDFKYNYYFFWKSIGLSSNVLKWISTFVTRVCNFSHGPFHYN